MLNNLADTLEPIFDRLDVEAPPASVVFARVARRRARRRRVTFATVAIIAVVAVAGFVVVAGRDSRPSVRVIAPATPSDDVFVPPTHPAGGDVGTTLTFADGTSAELTYPADLHLADLGFTPGGVTAVYPVRDIVDPCCNRELSIGYGDVSSAFGGMTGLSLPTKATKTYPGASQPVAYYEVNGDGFLIFQFGRWVVVARDGHIGSAGAMTDDQRAVLASSLGARVTGDGYLVLEPHTPVTLSPAPAPIGRFGDGNAQWLDIIERPCGPTTGERTQTGYSIADTGDPRRISLCTPDGYVLHAGGDPAFLAAVARGVRLTKAASPTATTSTTPTTPSTSTGRSTTRQPGAAVTYEEALAASDAIMRAYHGVYESPSTEVAAGFLEDGAALADFRSSLFDPTRAITIEVNSVALVDDHEATVTFSILDGTARLLNGYPGRAVLVDGTWKVARVTFCTLSAQGGHPCPQ